MEKIKAVILAGGQGTRLREETEFKPKPMVHIGERPILWHIMKIFCHYGFNDFVICLGYKGDIIKEYFLNYEYMNNNISLKTRAGSAKNAQILGTPENVEDWTISLINTGLLNMTGSRVKQIEPYIDGDVFFLCYGDGLANVNLKELLAFHRSHGKIATITGVHPPSRFGELVVRDGKVIQFEEKPQTHTGCINGGFFVFDKRVFKYLNHDEPCILEHGPLENLTQDGELMVYTHKGFWQCMDTLRDTNLLNSLWNSGNAPWKIWP